MSKHNQSAALGSISDFASSPSTPDEKLDRLERIENRLETIEKLLNTVLYAITDLNEVFDKVSKQPTPTQKPPAKPSAKLSAKPPAKPKKKAKGTADFTSHFSPEQLAEINANKEAVKALFSDRESLTKQEAVKLLDLDTKLTGRVLFVLGSEGFLSMREPKPTSENPDPKVKFTRR